MTPGSKKTSRLTKIFASLAAAATLAGCATTGNLTSPLNSDDQQNTQICLNFDQAQAKVKTIAVGTPKAQVYESFGIKGDDTLKRLNKEDINRALYGQTTLNIPFDKAQEAQAFLNTLEGRSLTCQNVHSAKKFALSHSQTEKTGYQYTLTFIFKDAVLFDPVTISGEPVREKTNRGYFNELDPLGTAVKAARF